MNKGKQITDQTLKGALVGAATYFMATAGFDAGLQAAIIPVLTAVLAYASTLVGDKAVASFISKAAKKDYVDLIKVVEQVAEAAQVPSVIEPPTTDLGAPAKKAVAKKAPAKKAAPKTSTTKK